MASLNAPSWRKSTFSGNAGNCVEVAWRKSSRSNQSCVEVAATSDVLVRDSKLGEQSPILKLSASAWTQFVGSIK